MHGGKIKVESEVGKGSVFTVTIPIGKEHLPANHVFETEQEDYESILPDMYVQEALRLIGNEETELTANNYQPGEVTLSTQPPAHVLVVDDNIDMRDYIARLLQKNYRVTTAVNGQQALEIIADEIPDLILSDIMMPVMDGIELLHQLKNNAATASVPVILLSARAGEEAKIEGYDIGADDYVVKPFSARELQARIKAQIKISAMRRETEHHLRNLFNHTPFPVAIMRGEQLVVELANEAMLEFWNRSQEKVLNRPLLEIFPEISDQSPYRMISKAMYTGKRLKENEKIVTYSRNDEFMSNAYYNGVYEPVTDETGRVTHVIVMVQDVTELVVARQLAQSSADELEKKVTDRTSELLHQNCTIAMNCL
jgi:PAS domain S-box-containing protein